MITQPTKRIAPGPASERMRAELRQSLEHALTVDLTVLPRSDLTLLRVDLDASKRLQTLCGQAAPWSEWRAARERIEAELELRPERPLIGKDLIR